MNHCISVLECVTPELIQLSRAKLPQEYIDTLSTKPHFEESLVARYILYTDLWYIPEFDETGKPIFRKWDFWSISHKPGFVYIGYGQNEKRTGVDIELCVPREVSVMELHTQEEYAFFGEKNWEHFYLLWTLKESVVKCFCGGLDDFWDIQIQGVSEKYTVYIHQDTDSHEDLTEYMPEWIVPKKEDKFFKYKRNIRGTFREHVWESEVNYERNGLVYAQTHEI